MNVILSFSPQVGFEEVANGNVVFNKNCWLQELAKKYVPNNDNPITYLGRDDKKRIELKMSIGLFEHLKNDKLFILKAETLRRLRTERSTLLEYITTIGVNVIDNDLD